MGGDSEYHIMAQVFRLERWWKISVKTCRDCISSVQKSCQVYSLVTDIEEFEQMDASEIYEKRLNAKKVLTPMSGEKFIFPITAKLS